MNTFYSKEYLEDYLKVNHNISDFYGMDDSEIVDAIVEEIPFPCQYSIIWEVAENIDEILEK